ncbi:hypothetical protein A9Q84_08570 [Halobacteriovorax marinus]|uniref:Thioredoxin domain-containing protein n=1 Tax=Halobacteriovorax marinus TaxID=97084 RepID=A0A1Y5F6N3_9BACT|nr:hypothetical protein A9Q84_08570 [Halobacteriovorax marinus]
MNKLILIFSFLISSPINSSEVKSLLSNLPCADQVFKSIAAIGTPKKWSKGKKSTVSTSMEEGGVVVISVSKNISRLSSDAHGVKLQLEFSRPTCKMKITNLTSSKGGFQDVDLGDLLLKNKYGVIYLWSPHMSLSLFELVELQKYVKSLKIPFTILMDLHADDKFAAKLLKKYDLPLEYLNRMNSRELEKFGITVHYPSTVFYKDKKLVKRVPGYNGKKSFKDLIKKYLEVKL